MIGQGGFVADLAVVLRGRDFRRLFAVRLTSQFGDGVLQVGFAAYVFFSPERQATAPAAAAALATLLLPFSVVGPFAGVLLDRWQRREVLLWANVVRTVLLVLLGLLVAADSAGVWFYATALVTLSVNRFFLAGLGASLPHVVPAHELVMANAVSPTCGTAAALLGAGAGFVVRETSSTVTPVYAFAGACYLVAALLALRIPPRLLGPDHPIVASFHHAASDVLRDLVSGVRHLHERHTAARALAVIGVSRFAYGLMVIMSLLLFRNYLNDPADTDAGLTGLATAITLSGVGFALAAFLTPIGARRYGIDQWIVGLLLLAAGASIFPTMLFTSWALWATAFLVGITAQGVKICVDTLVQTHVDDDFRGRVFSIYDVLFNVMFVLAAVVGALVLPENGKSYVVGAGLAILYAGAALAYRRDVRVPE